MSWVELHAHSFFSLLDASTSPEALLARAQALGMRALALTDHDSLAGAMRFHVEAKRIGVKSIFGAEVTLAGGAHLTLLARNQAGYANLCRIITRSRCDQIDPAGPWRGKLAPCVTADMLAAHAAGLEVLTGCRKGLVAGPLTRGDADGAARGLELLIELFGREALSVELQHQSLPGDDALIRQLTGLAKRYGLPVVATGNTHYATAEFARLRDCLLAIDANQTLTEARMAGLLPVNQAAALPASTQMARRFAELPEALTRTLAIAEACEVSLDFSDHRLPDFPVPQGQTAFSHLYGLCHTALPKRYPTLTPHVLKQLAHELAVIEKIGMAGFFLIVHDIIRFARENGVRCSGRGSAAGSIVSYLLGIGAVDPIEHDLLFERFLTEDKFTMPDIDVDFANGDAREKVIQYVFGRYGADHTAMVTNHVQFQARSALRELAKALGFPADVIERLSRQVDSHDAAKAAEQLEALAQGDAGATSHPIRLLAELVRQIGGVVRHLSIHVGGILITGPPLDQVVPIEPASMPNRYIVQWDKDSVEDGGLVKIDILGLGTLQLITDALALIQTHQGAHVDLEALPFTDPKVWERIGAGQTIGTFQVESRAQINMTTRTKPETIKDLAVEIAIVRPGPIQGGAVHPYLRRRTGQEPVTYPHPRLEPVLKASYGVLLFQEDCLRVAMIIAGFSPGEADQLRRAMSRARSREAMQEMRGRFLAGARAQGVDDIAAAQIFESVAAFSGFGFNRAHAASFAVISYHTVWLKEYYPTEFFAALLRAQPMGFYSPEVIAGDMRRHGVAMLPPDINASDWDYTVAGRRAIRMGLCTVAGLGGAAREIIEAARERGPFGDLADFCRRTQLPRPLIGDLIRAGLFDSLGDRRALLWQLGEISFEAAGLAMEVPIHQIALPPLLDLEVTLWDYELTGLSAAGHIMRHFRPALRQAGVMTAEQVKAQPNGRRVRVAGLQAIRQMPGSAKGFVFIGLEDETQNVDVVLKPALWQAVKAEIKTAMLILVEGEVQQNGGAVSVLVSAARAFPLLVGQAKALEGSKGGGGDYSRWHR